ncbi:MAG: LysR family transcriptional regulator [Motiliproteus sp.]
MDKIRTLRFFIATLDGGSFVSAAKTYGTDPSTVSKAIRRLEGDLGVQLIQRSTRQLQLTPAGQRYALTVRQLLDDLQGCEEQLKNQNKSASGTLKLNVPMSYGRQYIRPLIPAFCRQYPDIDVEIQFDDAYVDMIEQGIDVSIRSGSMQDSSLIARQLSPMDFLICASEDYLRRRGRPVTIDDLPRHNWIRFRFKQTGKLFPLMFEHQGQVQTLSVGHHCIVNDSDSMAELCAEGMGLTQIPHFIARNWIRSGQLVTLFPAIREPSMGVYLYYPKREFLPTKVRVFVDFLVNALAQQGETPKRLWTEELAGV